MQFKRILCATDFSASSREAVAVAAALARTGRSLDICHVVDRKRLAAELGGAPAADRLIDELARSSDAELEACRRQAAESVPAVRAQALSGHPWQEIVEAAGRLGSELIVVGAGRRQPRFLGSTAERIVRHAPCSVLVVAGCALLPRRILCAIDFSGASRDLTVIAADLARERDADLTLVHALSHPSELELPILTLKPSLLRDAHQRAAARVEGWAAEVELDGERVVTTEVLAGPAADAILDAARADNFDWILVGSHGRTGIARALLGSVAEGIVRRTDRPVLVVRKSR